MVKRRRTLEDFVWQYRKRAFQFAYQFCGRADEADDLVQEAFRRVLSEWHRYDPSRPLSTWYFSILRHLLIDNWKRYDCRMAISYERFAADSEISDTHNTESLLQQESTIPNQLERVEDDLFVRRVLGCLNREHRTVLTLCGLRGLKYKEASDALDVPLGTVRSRVSRAKTAFRQRFMGMVEEHAGRGE